MSTLPYLGGALLVLRSSEVSYIATRRRSRAAVTVTTTNPARFGPGTHDGAMHAARQRNINVRVVGICGSDSNRGLPRSATFIREIADASSIRHVSYGLPGAPWAVRLRVSNGGSRAWCHDENQTLSIRIDDYEYA